MNVFRIRLCSGFVRPCSMFSVHERFVSDEVFSNDDEVFSVHERCSLPALILNIDVLEAVWVQPRLNLEQSHCG